MVEPAPTDPPGWVHPNEVKRIFNMKMKSRALQARMNKSSSSQNNDSDLDTSINNSSLLLTASVPQKRKNPFLKKDSAKKTKFNDPALEIDASADAELFELMKNTSTGTAQKSISFQNSTLSFNSILSKLESASEPLAECEVDKGKPYMPLDWTLHTKMRLMSPQPFAWNGKLKTSEQASGTTGFVRCIDTNLQETTLDTSPNARFHQCCLVWQHPSLPWIQLFPRAAGKISASLAGNSAVAHSQTIKDALFCEWSESFRSLFHLLRARQCPYFYMCANTFTVLFRAAGICGVSEVHALLTPTTRGFRQALKSEEIVYTMPLQTGKKRRSDGVDSGCDTHDSTNSSLTTETDDDDDADDLLESLGIDDQEIRRIKDNQKHRVSKKESEVDSLKQSLVFVKGVEAQALFNLLINCKSAVPSTGALAGIPPTLLAPVAFHGACLKPLKIRENDICVDGEKYHSLEIRGPILPHVLPTLCSLMKSSQLEQYSVSCAPLMSTRALTEARNGLDSSTNAEKTKTDTNSQNVFGQENLSDCGFNAELLSHFCNTDASRIELFDSLKYSNEGYTWS